MAKGPRRGTDERREGLRINPLGRAPLLQYELRRALTRELGPGLDRLVVDIHLVRRDGRPVAPVPFFQLGRRSRADALGDPGDEKVAALLPGGEHAEWVPIEPGNRDGRYRLSGAQLERALPWILRSRRAEVDGGPRLVWVGDEPWRLEARFDRDDAADTSRLRFDLVRGDERIGFDEPELWRLGRHFVCDAVGGALASEAAARFAEDLVARGLDVVTRAREGELAQRLAAAPPGLSVAADTLPVGDPTAVLELRSPLAQRSLEVALAFDYGGTRVACGSLQGLVVQADGATMRRNTSAESALRARFAALGATAGTVDVALDALPELVANAADLGWRVEAERRPLRIAATQRAAVASGTDWFDLGGEVRFDEVAYASFEALVGAARAGERWVVLDDGSLGLVPAQWLASWSLLGLAKARSGGVLRFTRSQLWLLDAWLRRATESDADTAVELDESEALALVRARAARLAERAPLDPPKSFRGALRDYQRAALGWFEALREAGVGGCLADDMGLGKTVQVLAHLEARRLAGAGPMLVVAPRSVVHQWLQEAQRFVPELLAFEHGGAGRTTDLEPFGAGTLVVTSYGTLRRDIELLELVDFDVVVLDEANAVKNPASQTARAALRLRGATRLALTGTPIENSLGDLWALSEFMNPGLLGGRETYGRLLTLSAVGVDRADALAPLRRVIAPFFLRRTKGEVLASLPLRTEQSVLLTASPEEQQRYQALRAVIYDEVVVRAGSKLGLRALEGILRLRQEACHPGLIDPTLVDQGSTKVDEVVARLVEIAAEGHKALVFSQFTRLLAIVRARLDAAGVDYEYLDGSTTQRERPVQRFQDDARCTAFLISLKAGGYGLNLTAADFVLLLDPWWNPAAEAQAIDRAHRIGRTRPVVAYRFVMEGTIEEKVVTLQQHKRALADSILAADAGSPLELSREDLTALLR